MQKLIAFLHDERGATAIEYGLMAALIAVGCIAAFTAFGGSIKAIFGMSESGVGNRLVEAQGKLGWVRVDLSALALPPLDGEGSGAWRTK